MQGIYNYVPETNHVSRVHRVAAVLYLRSVPRVMLFCRDMFCTFTLAYYYYFGIYYYSIWMSPVTELFFPVLPLNQR